MLFFLAATYMYSLWLKETYKPIILQRRRKALGIQAPPRPAGGPGPISRFLSVTLLRPMMMLTTEPIVAFFSLYVAVDFGILFTFFACFPLVYSRVYKFNDGQIGLTFLPILVGCLLATLTAVLCDTFLYKKEVQKLNAGLKKAAESSTTQDEEFQIGQTEEGATQLPKYVEPEHRLYLAMIGSVGLPIGLFWFGWTARPDIHWASPVMATMVFAWGNLCLFVSAPPGCCDSILTKPNRYLQSSISLTAMVPPTELLRHRQMDFYGTFLRRHFRYSLYKVRLTSTA